MTRFWMMGVAVAAGLLAAGQTVAAAPAKHRHGHAVVADAGGDRPLTIGGRRGRGLIRSGKDIIAPGGFSAHGYGYPVATADDRRQALNARIRASASGPYGYDVYGLGGTGFGNDRESGGNPYWGNGFNSYVGYNGVPTALAFGPGFANRYLAEHDPEDDDDAPGPAPGDLGYRIDPDR